MSRSPLIASEVLAASWLRYPRRVGDRDHQTWDRRCCDESYEHDHDWDYGGMARRLRRLGHFRAGQVHRESTGRARVLRLQGIRRLAVCLDEPDGRSVEGDPRQPHDDRRLQGRHSWQWQAVPRRLQDCEGPVETEKEYG